METTIKFVDVPIIVKVPPKIEAYERGRRTFVGLIWKRWHILIARGMNIATAAVLLTKPEITAVISKKINIVNHLFCVALV